MLRLSITVVQIMLSMFQPCLIPFHKIIDTNSLPCLPSRPPCLPVRQVYQTYGETV
jgi:hypothetical protein